MNDNANSFVDLHIWPKNKKTHIFKVISLTGKPVMSQYLFWGLVEGGASNDQSKKVKNVQYDKFKKKYNSVVELKSLLMRP